MLLTREALLVTYVRAWPGIQYQTERKVRLSWPQEPASSNLGAPPLTSFFSMHNLVGSVIDHNLSISHYPANMLNHRVDVGERIAIDGNQIS